MTDRKPIGKVALQQRAGVPEAQGARDTAVEDLSVFGDLATLRQLSERFGVQSIDLSQACIRLEDLDLVPREIAERHRILPLLVREDAVFLAMADPGDSKVIDELEFVTGRKVVPYAAIEPALMRTLAAAYEQRGLGERVYVGPAAPPDAVSRVGAEPRPAPAPSVPPPAAAAPAPPPARMPAAAPAPARPASAAAAPAPWDDADDDGFGAVSPDISSLGDLDLVQGPPPSAVGPDARTVLVVDDEPDIRRMLRRLLTDKGYRVLEADRGMLALQMIKQATPDLVVLDAMLPEMHGLEIARRIKQSRKYAHIPVIMISAVYRGWRYVEDIKATCGVEEYLEKPFKMADVLAAVERALEASRTGAAPAREDRQAVAAAAERALSEGVAAYRAGDMDVAIQRMQEGLQIDPLSYRLHFHLGLLYGKKGLIYEAIYEIESALDINSRHFPAVKNLAVLYQRAGFRNKAIEMWERALGLAPDEPTRQSIKAHLVGLL